MSKELEAFNKLVHKEELNGFCIYTPINFTQKPKGTRDEYYKIVEQSLTPSVEQEEALKIVDWLTVGHPTSKTYIDGLRKDGYVNLATEYEEDDKKCEKLHQYIMKPNKAVDETTVEHIYTHFRCDVYFEVRETNGNTIFQGERFSEKDKAIYQRKLASIAGKHIILYAKEIEGEK